jgi:hypothetical protein
MDMNNFKERFIFSLIDKVIIGSIAALIVLLFNAKYNEYQKLREQQIAVSKIYTEILLQHRGELVQSMQQYFSVLKEILYNEQIDPDHLVTLTKIKNQVNFAISNLNTLDSRVENDAAPLLASLEKTNNHLRNLYRAHERDFEILQQSINQEEAEIRGLYHNFLNDLRNVSIKIVKRDIESL